ncbi:hypothetical protein [Commensalibacter nepenthis]|uniref:Uncharacterized protein n=1 Tax=Commensalibacter nepenthis TaxID=3043872 RepID=A0ABT6Q7A4_9PROT|nr:hypothetical protein [Commensalibacter sp. TBRC 10068]MDI2112767.1 hypothetical protein [Commensalibacter sp. TBRC 10068]
MSIDIYSKLILRSKDDFKGKWTINEQIKLIQNIFGLNNNIPV